MSEVQRCLSACLTGWRFLHRRGDDVSRNPGAGRNLPVAPAEQQLLISRRHERLQNHQVHLVYLLLLFLGESDAVRASVTTTTVGRSAAQTPEEEEEEEEQLNLLRSLTTSSSSNVAPQM